MSDNGFQITTAQVITPAGDFQVDDIRGAESRTSRPIWGPLMLALLGTVNLLIAFQSGFWLDFSAAGLMLGVGVIWRVLGTKYVLTLELASGKVDAWFARREAPVQQALRVLRQRLPAQRHHDG